MTGPQVSVVMATYGRGRHILPSIRSVLGQTFADFELLVVGDACTDETAAVVGAVDDPRVRWLNLEQRVGSQSGPNNAGVDAARGVIIAYLGHDDIWERDHLKRLVGLYDADDPPDFAVSGSIYHLPNGVPGCQVMGLFEAGEDISPYFFPPSSFSHRKAALSEIGPWGMPMECRAPVDEDLLLRAVAAGMRFRSTGVVTLHKFAAGHRYLSYLRQESDEQAEMLAGLGTEAHRKRVAALIEDARRMGSFMPKGNRNFDHHAPGDLARANAARKGLRHVDLLPLGSGVTVRHGVEDGVFDWRRRPGLGFRLTRANPKPRLLLPVVGRRARLRFWLACQSRAGLGPLEMRANGEALVARPGRRWFGLVAWIASYEVEVSLLSAEPTLLELHLAGPQRPGDGTRGVAIGPMHLTPV